MKHSVIYFSARGLSGVINLCAIAVYTRLASPDVYGQFVMILAVVEFLNAIMFQWIRFGILRYAQRYSKDYRVDFLNTIVVLFFTMLILTLILFIFVYLCSIDIGKWGEYWFFSIILLWILAWYDLNLELLRADLFPKFYGWIVISRSILTFTCTVMMLIFGIGANGFIIGMMVGMLFPMLFVMKRNWIGIRFPEINSTICKEMITYGLPLTITFSTHFLMVSSDRLLLGWLQGSSESGLYSAAYDLTQQTLLLIMTIINLSAYPIVVRTLENEGVKETKKRLRQYTTSLFFVSIPATAGYIILSPNISRLFLGSNFIEASLIIMPLIALTAFLQGIKQYYLDLSFQLAQRTWFQIWPNMLAASTNIALNFFWIPKWGILGAVYATLFSNFISIVLSWFIGRKIFVLPFPLKEILKIIVATVMMMCTLNSMVIYSGFLSLCAHIVLGAFIYILVGLLMKIGGYHRYFISTLDRIIRKK
ncbi:lipopolysaccharide biosynthesis protein [Seinonella peptonophila]|nr:polysaccharide biosynthesis C-terminal domain-containing protein [Seinonella peptonophila]